MREPAELERQVDDARQGFEALRRAVGRTFLGHEEAVELCLCALLAEGHVLLEGVPGLGKTTLARALARSLGLSFARIQFTPDLVPADVLGARILEEDEDGRRHLRFERGPVFAHLVLADEINRATPRTQSALLEAMQERQVTAFGETLPLGPPFLLIATENPIEMEGTYPLPEAQLDRFLLKIDLTFPGPRELVRILAGTEPAPPEPVMGRDDVLRLAALARDVPVSTDLLERVARIVLATHPEHDPAPEPVRRAVRHGASPRGGEAILRAARARALVRGRMFVADEDVEAVAPAALRHRLILSYEGEASGARPDDLVAAALAAAS